LINRGGHLLEYEMQAITASLKVLRKLRDQ
jgi:hypothetical protein